MKKKEIFFVNLKIEIKGKEKILEKIIYKEEDGFYRNKRVLKKNGIKEDLVKVVSFEVIKSLGFDNITEESTSFNQSEEKRNKITGAYE